MTTLTVNIEDKKHIKAVKAMFDALGLDYSTSTEPAKRVMNKKEEALYKQLESSLKEIKLFKEGKLELQDAKEWLNEL